MSLEFQSPSKERTYRYFYKKLELACVVPSEEGIQALVIIQKFEFSVHSTGNLAFSAVIPDADLSALALAAAGSGMTAS